MANTLGGLSIDSIQNWRPMKNAPGLNANPIPGLDATQTEIFDLQGAIKTISFVSRFNGTLAQNRSTLEALEGLIDGDQQATVALVSDFLSSSITVKVKSVEVVQWFSPGTVMDVQIQVIVGV